MMETIKFINFSLNYSDKNNYLERIFLALNIIDYFFVWLVIFFPVNIDYIFMIKL